MKVERYSNCHDCGVSIGQVHEEGCDNPTCTQCGIQLLQCGHWKTGNSTFTGTMHPESHLIAEMLKIYVVMRKGNGLTRCDENTPGATHDLNLANELQLLAHIRLYGREVEEVETDA